MMKSDNGSEGISQYDYLIPVSLFGEVNVGKTCIASRFKYGRYEEYVPTLYMEFTEKTIDIEGVNVRLSLWDSAGDIGLRDTVQQTFRGKPAGLVVFDITDRNTFMNVRGWIDKLFELADQEVEIVLIGSKHDLCDVRAVEVEEAQALASEYGIVYFEVSAFTGHNVDEVFRYIGAKVTHKIKENKFDIEHGHSGIRRKGYNVTSSSKVTKKEFNRKNNWISSFCGKIGRLILRLFGKGD